MDLLYFHLALECINNPELTGYCFEGNVLHEGLDTADTEETGTSNKIANPKDNKRKERHGNVQYQRDMLNYMQERNCGDVRANQVTMLKELNIALSVLTQTFSATQER